MKFFDLCEEQCVYQHITPRNSHIKRRYQQKSAQAWTNSKNQQNKCFIPSKDKAELQQVGSFQHPKKSLKKKDSKKVIVSSLKTSVPTFCESEYSLNKMQSQTPRKKTGIQVPNQVNYEHRLTTKNSLSQLQSFYHYGLMEGENNLNRKIDGGNKKPQVKFIYECSEEKKQVTQQQKKGKHQRKLTSPTLHTIQTITTKYVGDQNINISDSKLKNQGATEQWRKIQGFDKIIRRQMNNQNRARESHSFRGFLTTKPSLTRSRMHLDELSCIKAQSVNDNSNIDYSQRCSEVMEDSIILRLKKCQSADYFGYNMAQGSKLANMSRIYIN